MVLSAGRQCGNHRILASATGIPNKCKSAPPKQPELDRQTALKPFKYFDKGCRFDSSYRLVSNPSHPSFLSLDSVRFRSSAHYPLSIRPCLFRLRGGDLSKRETLAWFPFAAYRRVLSFIP